ncbi:MAG: hypothetical protein LBU36_04215 [Clostridiales bacterium]|jgi:hypothetical protein|nr:hypothetical protein [Clostridiales bacterium]
MLPFNNFSNSNARAGAGPAQFSGGRPAFGPQNGPFPGGAPPGQQPLNRGDRPPQPGLPQAARQGPANHNRAPQQPQGQPFGRGQPPQNRGQNPQFSQPQAPQFSQPQASGQNAGFGPGRGATPQNPQFSQPQASGQPRDSRADGVFFEEADPRVLAKYGGGSGTPYPGQQNPAAPAMPQRPSAGPDEANPAQAADPPGGGAISGGAFYMASAAPGLPDRLVALAQNERNARAYYEKLAPLAPDGEKRARIAQIGSRSGKRREAFEKVARAFSESPVVITEAETENVRRFAAGARFAVSEEIPLIAELYELCESALLSQEHRETFKTALLGKLCDLLALNSVIS